MDPVVRGLLMSVDGTFETCRVTPAMSANQGKTGSERRTVKVTRLTQLGPCIIGISYEPLRPLLDLTSGGSTEGLGHGYCTIYTLQKRQT
jgi:hypothetical protein